MAMPASFDMPISTECQSSNDRIQTKDGGGCDSIGRLLSYFGRLHISQLECSG